MKFALKCNTHPECAEMDRQYIKEKAGIDLSMLMGQFSYLLLEAESYTAALPVLRAAQEVIRNQEGPTHPIVVWDESQSKFIDESAYICQLESNILMLRKAMAGMLDSEAESSAVGDDDQPHRDEMGGEHGRSEY